MAAKKKNTAFAWKTPKSPSRVKNDNLIKTAVAEKPGCSLGDIFDYSRTHTTNRTNGETAARLRIYEGVQDLVRRKELKEVRDEDGRRYYPADE